MKEKIAYFAGGCFWCITPIFKIYGANQVIAGYSGGDEIDPTYELVKSQTTRHRETIAIYYDEEKISYSKLVDLFLFNVDPFNQFGQYIDIGYSYTLAIYYNDDSEKLIAQEKIDNLSLNSTKKIYISLEKFKTFYKAEEYHQDYYLKHPKEFEEELIKSKRK